MVFCWPSIGFVSTSKKITCNPLSNELIYYRLKLVTENGREYISTIISLKNRLHAGGIRIIGNNNDEIIVNSADVYTFRLLIINGQLIHSGKLQPGINHIAASTVKGLLVLYCSNGYQSLTQKIVKQ